MGAWVGFLSLPYWRDYFHGTAGLVLHADAKTDLVPHGRYQLNIYIYLGFRLSDVAKCMSREWVTTENCNLRLQASRRAGIAGSSA
jgi:hypothetical protein